MPDPQAEIVEDQAGLARRVVFTLLGSVPDDGDQPAILRLASDIGMIRAIADNWWANLPGDAVAVAEESRRRAAVLLAGGDTR